MAARSDTTDGCAVSKSTLRIRVPVTVTACRVLACSGAAWSAPAGASCANALPASANAPTAKAVCTAVVSLFVSNFIWDLSTFWLLAFGYLTNQPLQSRNLLNRDWGTFESGPGTTTDVPWRRIGRQEITGAGWTLSKRSAKRNDSITFHWATCAGRMDGRHTRPKARAAPVNLAQLDHPCAACPSARPDRCAARPGPP